MDPLRFGFTGPLLLLLVALLPGGRAAAQPNIVFIFADDLGYGDLGCFGNPTIRTPNLDRMACEGMKLTQFYSASSICSPARASFLTGRLPKRCGVTGIIWPETEVGLPLDEVTLAEVLRDAGYATACIGKWHLGNKDGYLPTDRGFDSFYGLPGSNDMWIDPEAEFAPDALLRNGVTIEGVRNGEYTEHAPRYVPLMRDRLVIEFPANQRTLAQRYTTEAVAFIRAHKNDPFFLYLPSHAPHFPLDASDAFRGKSPRGLYGDVVEELDWSVGQILDTLEQEGIANNTLVIFSSDNGPWEIAQLSAGSSGPLRGGKYSTWEGGQRAPTIAWWPGTVPAGVVSQELSSTLDLLPTFAELAGGQLPAGRVFDGVSIAPVLEQTAPSPRDAMFYYRNGNLYAVRYGAWKMHYATISDSGSGAFITRNPPWLFNVDQDPGEKYEVGAANPSVMAELQVVADLHLASFLCPADINTVNTNPGDARYGSPDGIIDGADLSYFVEGFLALDPLRADFTTRNTNPGDTYYGVPEGNVDGADLSYYVELWLAACQ